jgi:hypothetical protein
VTYRRTVSFDARRHRPVPRRPDLVESEVSGAGLKAAYQKAKMLGWFAPVVRG